MSGSGADGGTPYTDVASIRFDVKTLATQYLAAAPGPARDAMLTECVGAVVVVVLVAPFLLLLLLVSSSSSGGGPPPLAC